MKVIYCTLLSLVFASHALGEDSVADTVEQQKVQREDAGQPIEQTEPPKNAALLASPNLIPSITSEPALRSAGYSTSMLVSLETQPPLADAIASSGKVVPSAKKASRPESSGIAHTQAASEVSPRSEEARLMGDLGLELSFGTGINLCVPRGDASWTDLLPGPYYTLGFQYRFWRMGLALTHAAGMHVPMGTGAEDVSVRTDHFTMDVMGYFPKVGDVEPFAGVGLGYGNIRTSDGGSDSRASWSSLWQTARLSGGVRGRLPTDWLPGNGWFWETYGALYLHQGGERCVFYAAQGACRLTEELSGGDTDYASTLELGGRVGWSF